MDKKKVEHAVDEIVNSMTRIDAENDNIKVILDDLKENFELKPPMIRKIAKIRHEMSLMTEKDKSEQIFDLYEELYPTTRAE